MSEFKTGFIDGYRADIISMLDMAEELPLFHKPSITIKGNIYSDDINFDVAGQALADQDTESVEGIQAHTDAAVGMTILYSLGTRSTMQLFDSELRTKIPPETVKYTSEQRELIEGLVQKAQVEIDSSDYRYSAFKFSKSDLGESIEVKDSSLTGATSNVRARCLTLSICDAYVRKEVTISELPISFYGETTLDISQSISPVDDNTLHEAAELFYEDGTPEDMGVLLSLFASELTGKGNADTEVKDLLARFEAKAGIDRLKKILEAIKQKAEAAKLNSAFNLASPEMTLPSATELSEYMTLLDQLRS